MQAVKKHFILEKSVHGTRMSPYPAKVNRDIYLEQVTEYYAIVQAVNFVFKPEECLHRTWMHPLPSKVNQGITLAL